MIKVINIYKNRPGDGIHVEIMRPNILSNPYKIDDTQSRGVVLQKFKVYAMQQMASDTPFRREIQRLAALHTDGQDIWLICCCKPKPCHGDYIKELILLESS